VIVRIATEGQYELGDADIGELNKLDDDVLKACDGGQEASFEAAFTKLLDYVRTRGKRVGEDVLIGSDVILPPPDVSIDEAKAELTGEGLIPD
jgi:hypothetical protein